MKFDKFSQPSILGSAALALILAMGTAYAGKPGANPEGGNNKGGASIGVSNTCELAVNDKDTGEPIKPVLRVTTTIINKSSDVIDDDVDFSPDGNRVRAKEKGSGKGEKYEQVGETVDIQPIVGTFSTDVQLCNGDSYAGPDNTVSLNASVVINVDNDNKGEYASRCSDDPATEGVDEGKIAVSAADLNLLCSQ